MAQPSRAEYNTRIREIPSTDRPRERLRDLGARNLTTAELLAIVLRTGHQKQSVLGFAGSLLARHRNLAGLARLSFSDLKREPGFGDAKAAELLAIFELGRRYMAETPEDRPYVREAADVQALLGAEMELLDQEHMRVVLLNTRNQVIAISDVYKGNVGSAFVRPAEVFREAVRQNAPSIIVVHNHPSGDPSPSNDDVALTKELGEAGKLLGIELLDHVIIGHRRFASLNQLGLWPAK